MQYNEREDDIKFSCYIFVVKNFILRHNAKSDTVKII